MTESGEITRLLEAHLRGDDRALPEVFACIYGELKRVAHGQRFRHSPAGETMSTTALVHEAYLKLAGGGARAGGHRGHFFAVAATAMRHVLVDHARAVQRAKRGGGFERAPLEVDEVAVEREVELVLAVDRALEKLESLEPRLARIVECRHFLGLTETETAETLGVSLRTAQRDFRAASLWLRRELGDRSRTESPA